MIELAGMPLTNRSIVTSFAVLFEYLPVGHARTAEAEEIGISNTFEHARELTCNCIEGKILGILAVPGASKSPPKGCARYSCRLGRCNTEKDTVAPRSNAQHSPQPRTAPFDWGLAMGLGVPDFSARRFSANSDSLARTRRFTHHTLTLWGRYSCADEVTIVVGELVANAVRHALAAHPGRHGWLGLMKTSSTVICAVQDPSPDRPLPRTATDTDTRGRGLLIIDELAHDWGYSLHDNAGKTVWAVVPTTITPCTASTRARQDRTAPWQAEPTPHQ
ncbi:ATP-binding protein [Streptomyces hygroscopicus]|uniref:ATP-binding protein n=1 Tax=Streptomyces hygroscopicus TaxID=1912 RepID=UPI001FD3676A|nr:ATP-binding protein [Streptomyces hygroscopicus]